MQDFADWNSGLPVTRAEVHAPNPPDMSQAQPSKMPLEKSFHGLHVVPLDRAHQRQTE